MSRGLTKAFEKSFKEIIDGGYTYDEAVSKSIAWDIKLEEGEDFAGKGLVVSKKSKKCFPCGKIRHLDKYCRKKKTQKRDGNKSE